MEAIDVYDSRAVLRWLRLAASQGPPGGSPGAGSVPQALARRAASARYFAILGNGAIGAGTEPRPYFYVYGLDCDEVERRVLEEVYFAAAGGVAAGETVDAERVDCASAGGRCIEAVFVYTGGRWRLVRATCVYKVSVSRPELVRAARGPVLEAARATGYRVYASGFNIRYPVRVSWDLGLSYGMKPLYVEPVAPGEVPAPREPILVFDIEVVGDYIIASFYRLRLLSDVAADDVWTVRCRAGRDCDELLESFKGARIVYGHNILGFDIPILLRNWFIPELVLASKLDGVKILASHGSSFQVGSSLSLLSVARRLRDAAGITREELELKARSESILSSGDLDEIERYNRNDVVLTAKVANVLLPYIFLVAAVTGVPPSQAQELPAGIIAEYFLYRFYEYRGILVGYKESGARLQGEKVLLPGAIRPEALLSEILGGGGG